jgi:hypothetical protein
MPGHFLVCGHRMIPFMRNSPRSRNQQTIAACLAGTPGVGARLAVRATKQQESVMFRWIPVAFAAASLAGATGASAQTYIAEDTYAVAPPPVFEMAPPAVAYAAPVYAHRRVYVERHTFVPAVNGRVIVTERYGAPIAPYARVYGDGYVDADW